MAPEGPVPSVNLEQPEDFQHHVRPFFRGYAPPLAVHHEAPLKAVKEQENVGDGGGRIIPPSCKPRQVGTPLLRSHFSVVEPLLQQRHRR